MAESGVAGIRQPPKITSLLRSGLNEADAGARCESEWSNRNDKCCRLSRAAKIESEMPKQYDQEAIELARKLYCKYGGKNLVALEKEMREVYPGWLKQTLLDRRGSEANFREGWINKYGFDKSLQEYLKTQIAGVTDDVQKLYLGIKGVRESLEKKVNNGNGTRDEIYAYRDFCKLEMEARQKLDLEKDNYESFVACWEKLLVWLPEISESAAVAFLTGDTAEKVLERARIEYGEQEN